MRPLALIVTLLAVLLTACAEPTPSSPEPSPEPTPDDAVAGWQVVDGRILDPEGRQRILHGINLSNDVKQPPYESWTQEEDYARLESWGLSTLRLLTGWAAIMPTEGTIDADYLDRYEARVDLAEAHGLTVIVDMHQDVFGEGFGGNGGPLWACDEALYAAFQPQSPWYLAYFEPQVQECYDRFWSSEALQDRFIEAFVAVAERVGNRPSVIGFDLFNEPHWGTTPATQFEAELLQPFYERVMDAVSEVAPGKLFFVESTTMVQLGLEPGFVPFSHPGIVFAPHYYDRGVHDDHEWDGNASILESIFARYQATADRLGAGLLLGEFGGFVDGTDFDAYITAVLAQLDRHQAGHTYWTYDPGDGGFGPINADHSEKDVIVDLLARVSPVAASGDLVEYGLFEGAFSLTLDNARGLPPAVELALPAARHYPEGYVLQSSDPEGRWSWAEDADRRRLTVTFDPDQPRHDLSLCVSGGCP